MISENHCSSFLFPLTNWKFQHATFLLYMSREAGKSISSSVVLLAALSDCGSRLQQQSSLGFGGFMQARSLFAWTLAM